jgi:hypothetical protein
MSREDDTSWLSPMLRMRQIRICYPPNGRRIVYSGLADLDDNGDYHSDIYTINAVGEVRPKLPTPTTRAKSILPGGAARSGFSCERSQQPRSRRGPGITASVLLLVLIQRSAWKGYSPKFA